MTKISKMLPLVLLCVLSAGCQQHQAASPPAATTPAALLKRLADIDRQRRAAPDDITLRAERASVIKQLATDYLYQADQAVRRNNYVQAAQLWQSALTYEPGNLRAQQGLHKLNARRALDKMYRQAVELAEKSPDQALAKLLPVLEEDPNWPQARTLHDHLMREVALRNQPETHLNQELQRRISVNFRQHNLQAIFNTISQLTGVNIIFDKDVSPGLTASLIVKQTTAEDAINVLLIANGLRKKILSGNTLLVYPATLQKEKLYQDIIVKTIFLAYARAKEVNVALRNMVKLKDLHIDERTNSITIRGSRESVEKATRLLVTLDRPEAEVTLAVEVLEVNTSDIEALGVKLPQKVSAGFAYEGETSNIPLDALSRKNLVVNIDNVSIDMKKVLSHARIVANPRIRVKNNKKALIDIGETIPVLTSTISEGFSQQKVEYQDVGLKLEVTPEISMDDNISMDVKFTLSSLGAAEKGEKDTVYYRTNKREANTILSSMNGETQMLAGLIKQDEASTNNGTPVLSKIPLLGRLFGSQSESQQRTEVILLITPTIERNIDLPGSHISTIEMGSEEYTGESLQLHDATDPESDNFTTPTQAPQAQFPSHSPSLPPPVLDHDLSSKGNR